LTITSAVRFVRSGIPSVVAIFLLFAPALRAQETGEGLFKSKCAMCHGADASGKTVMGEKLKVPDLHSPETQGKSEADLKALISKGKNKMPSYEGKLTKEQIDKLADYIRKLAKH